MDQIIGGLWPLSQKILFHFKVSKINIIIIVTNLDSKHTHTHFVSRKIMLIIAKKATTNSTE